MDFCYKPQGDMNIVRGFMAKIGAQDQSFVYQRKQIGMIPHTAG
jgi:hypothetical protein